jgi:hypothetical protein
MHTSGLVRRGGLAAVIGSAIGIVWAPLYALAHFATADNDPVVVPPPLVPWHHAARPVLEPLLTFASPDVVLLTYGKAALVMGLGWLVGAIALHARQAQHAGQLEKWGFRVVGAGVSWFIVGTVGAYWVGTVVPEAGDFSFWVFILPGVLVMSIGWPLFGIASLRSGVAPRWAGWLLTVGWFPGWVALTSLFGQLSLGTLLLNVAWIGVGYALWSQPSPVATPAPADSRR